jgi:hypothetical protein
VLPQVIEDQVDGGQAKIAFRNFTIIGPQSLPAGAAAIAAGEQGRGWNLLEIFDRNQGGENSGYVTDEFLESRKPAASSTSARRHRSRFGDPSPAAWNSSELPTASPRSKRRSRKSAEEGCNTL